MTDHAQDQRRNLILRRDALGRARYELKRWWHGSGPLLTLLVIIYLVASNFDYREDLERERLRADAATERAQRAENWQRIEPFVFVIEARNPAELERKLRDIRNGANDNILHSQAARK